MAIVRRIMHRLAALWRGLRTILGDDAYERYLAHWQTQHSGEGAPLDRRAFYQAEEKRKWNEIRRCC